MANIETLKRGNTQIAPRTLAKAVTLQSGETVEAKMKLKADKATTLAGYGITDAITAEDALELIRSNSQNNDSSLVVDQTYNPESQNAQSGKAVAQAISTINIPNGEHPTDTVMWKEPKNFGKKVNNVIGDNIKVYRDIYDETLVFVGSGEMYEGTKYNDAYLIECGCIAGNQTVRNIVLQEGITSIGANVFNRFYSAKSNNVKKINTNTFSEIGATIRQVVTPKSLSKFGYRCFQYSQVSDAIKINCDNSLMLGGGAFSGSWFQTIEIPNATSIYGYDNTTFSIAYLKNFSIGQDTCYFETNVSFGNCGMLTVDSIINIANHLKPLTSDETVQTITLHSTAKTYCSDTKGDITNGIFVKNTSGTVTLSEFITNTKGWTIA